ncbi:MAG: AAA family ATPase [Planctomycetaceae bacterium]|nr:AAA family ATPase [Planctomycetaceae bacterium]
MTPDTAPIESWVSQLNATSVAHQTTQWEVLQTHISWVILTGSFAYKIKKPVRFEFVDYQSLEQRRHFCELELEFNRRFCPELYLDCVPIVCVSDTILIDPVAHGVSFTPKQVIEYAVKMRQFPQEEIVGRHLGARDQPMMETRRLAAQFGSDLAHLHANLPTLPAERCDWYINGVQHDSEENFHYFQATTQAMPSRSVHFASPQTWLDRVAQLQAWSQTQLLKINSSLAVRARSGHVRQCHGDLHLQNIVHWQGKWAAFDGIEFNDRFQWIDVFSESAFTAMDLQAYGRADLRAVFLSEYLEATGEYHDLEVLRFFLVYRAMVRAKIGHLKGVNCGSLSPAELSLAEASVDPCDTTAEFQALPEWQRYLLVAERLACGSRPKLIIMHGLSGSGKSTVAQSLVAEHRGLRVRSDRVRQWVSSATSPDQRYATASRDQVYDELEVIADDILGAGFTAIIDATFLQQRHRRQMWAIAARHQVPFLIARCSASLAELEQRIRQRTNDPSEATLSVLHQQVLEQEPLSTEELAHLLPESIDAT